MPIAYLLSLIAAPTIVTSSVAPPPPPVVMQSGPYRIIRSDEPQTTQIYAVRLSENGRTLWSGELTRASRGTAGFSQSLSESRACTPVPGQRGTNADSGRSSISVSLMADYASADGIRLSVERTVPAGRNDPSCMGSGTDSIRFDRRLDLQPGKTETISGEGGLSLTITRR
jgi:hypothetical protein